MKIGFVSTQRGWGGGENLLAQLITGVGRLGAEATLAAPRGSAMAKWAIEHAGEGVSLREMPGRGRGPGAVWRLRGWFADERCDVALLNDPHAITWGGMALTGTATPRIGIRHTSFPVRSAWKHNRLIDRVVCVSEAARDECHKVGVASDRLSVIYAGLDPPRCEPAEAEAVRASFERAASSPEEKHLLAIGSLLPVKGFDALVRAVAEGAERGHRWRLWIAGEGPEREALTGLATQLGVADRVHLLGFRRDIGALLGAADLFVSASHREGLSLVLIEAMLAGRPVVATPVGGNREALRTGEGLDSDVAWAFDPDDVQRLVGLIEQASEDSDECQARVAAAQDWAQERFSLERMARDYLDVFEQALGKTDRSRSAA